MGSGIYPIPRKQMFESVAFYFTVEMNVAVCHSWSIMLMWIEICAGPKLRHVCSPAHRKKCQGLNKM
jgi:hypothetical protein